MTRQRFGLPPSKHLPGLVVEAASLDNLAEEVKRLVPQLLALQKKPTASKVPKKVPIEMSQRLVAMA